MEVLDQGGRPPSRHRRWWIAGAVAVAAVVGALAIRALAVGDAPAELRIASITVVEPRAVSPNAQRSGWAGAPGIPADAVLPGAVVDIAIDPDPIRRTTVRPAESAGALHIEPGTPVEIPAGTPGTVRVVLSPADCGAPRSPTGLDEAGYRWREAAGVRLIVDTEGTALPLSEAARHSLAQLLADQCAPAGESPRITTVDAQLDGPPREQTLEVTVQLDTGATPLDKVTINPLDGPGLRGIGSFARQTSDDITLMWTVAPLGELTDGQLIPTAQVVTVIDGTAYPWLLRIEPRTPPPEVAVNPQG